MQGALMTGDGPPAPPPNSADCLTCKAVSTGGILGISGYLLLMSYRIPAHSPYLRLASASTPLPHTPFAFDPCLGFGLAAGLNWHMRSNAGANASQRTGHK